MTHTARIPWPGSPFPPPTSAISRPTVAEYAPRPGRMLLFLEGGYDLTALRDSVAATVGRLVEAEVPGDTAPTSGGPGLDWVARALRTRQVLES